VLHAEVSGSGKPVVLLHGFTQSASAWGRVAERLARDHTVVRLDAPGHGRSASVAAGLTDGADLMVDTVAATTSTGSRAPRWVGYSMGGRYALQVALRHPSAVSRLVLVSATAGIDDPDERRRRQESDEARAAWVEEIGLEAFVKEWLTQPLFATLPPEAAAVESRLGGTAPGLASSLRLAGTGCQEPVWNRLDRLDMPVLVVAGALDPRYVGLARRLVDGIGANAHLAIIGDAGHACHLERPEPFLDAVVPFLAASDP
jgi:2-succinyl-6-hydroxy-2,4-cyclohexadiene-1-carboxylate synthase